MWVNSLSCIAFVVFFALVAGQSDSGSGRHPQGLRDCSEVYLAGGRVEGYYAVFNNASNPFEAGLVFCGDTEGMIGQDSSILKTNARNCRDLRDGGMSESGINVIYPWKDHLDTPVIVFCEQALLGGGWVEFQRRDDYPTQLDFYRTFADYSLGFGQVGSEFWLGNDILHELTRQSVNELYVELTSFAGVTKYAHYQIFDVANKTAYHPYQLTVAHYSGDAGDDLMKHNGMGFSTYDDDNDSSSGQNCAESFKGGWWYFSCHYSNLNGVYFEDGRSDPTSDCWHSFANNYISLKTVRMLTRPLQQQ